MKKVSKKRVAFLLFLFVSYLFCWRHELVELAENIVYEDYVMEELTVEQKAEDFEMLFENITSSVPFIEDLEEVYGINFCKRKEYYLEEIRKTQSNFEFYSVMKAVLEDVPSFHTDIGFPHYENLKRMSCYGSDEVFEQLGYEKKINEWTKEIERNVLLFDEIDLISAFYIDGEYVVQKIKMSEEYSLLKNTKLIFIDGVETDEYLRNNISTYRLCYDGKNEKAYRMLCTFNNSKGKKVNTIWQDAEGGFIEKELYLDLGAEIAFNYGWLFSDKYKNSNLEISVILMQRDLQNNLEYIEIRNFSNSDGRKLFDYLKNSPCKKIVIDMRSNTGGLKSYGQDYLYPALYKEDICFDIEWKIPNTKANSVIIEDFEVKMAYLEAKDEEYNYYKDRRKYKGNTEENKEVYYLMGRYTGSAADGFLQMVKQNDLGIIVGNNSAGEGLGNSYVCNSLKHSALIYTYYPAMTLTEDGVCSSAYGTTPDIYINQTVEDYALEMYYTEVGGAQEYEKNLNMILT